MEHPSITICNTVADSNGKIFDTFSDLLMKIVIVNQTPFGISTKVLNNEQRSRIVSALHRELLAL